MKEEEGRQDEGRRRQEGGSNSQKPQCHYRLDTSMKKHVETNGFKKYEESRKDLPHPLS